LKNALIIFTRNPELGKGKRRLAATIGDTATLAIYIFLLDHTRSITSQLAVTKQVWYSEHIHKEDAWDNAVYDKYEQQGADLGERMQHAFETAFKNHDKVIIVGSDMHDLTQADLEYAFKQLDRQDVVIGPATDGGYYLLGFNGRVPAGVFVNKEWGTDSVLKATLATLKDIKIAQLTPRNDVDYYDDIKDIDVFQPFLKEYLQANK
jgi:rSAM/selenodomain-associated transferase 1